MNNISKLTDFLHITLALDHGSKTTSQIKTQIKTHMTRKLGLRAS